MADDSLQRFQKVMDKLYHAPKQKPSLSHSGGGADALKKNKKPDWGSRRREENGYKASVASSFMSKDAQACRPWDRRDLLRRLATFKAMTWFGKPKVVSALNCARRGWVNVGMDTIACEACGSRLLFSTPSSWTYQQVEKAAAVFSLKLDNGHKLLCPWMDNTCDESLALFRPTPQPELVKAYEERCNAILQLSALPVISSSAISWMGCEALEKILEESSSLECTLESGIKITERSAAGNEELVSDTATSSLYIQAKKIIALCGWEVRFLPYSVEGENVKNSDEKELSEKPGGTSSNKGNDMVIDPESSSMEVSGEKNIYPLVRSQPDLASAVLDCKMCGACVGLWMFKSIPRPLEAFTLTDVPNSSEQSSSMAQFAGENPEILGDTTKEATLNNGNRERNLTLSLTIAGGAPPTKQNFRPRISFPIVSRHLRADLSSTEYAESQDRTGVELVKSTNILKRKRDEDDCSLPDGSNCDMPSDQNHVSRKEDSGGSGHEVLFTQGKHVSQNEDPSVDDENSNTEAANNGTTNTFNPQNTYNESSNVGSSVPGPAASDSIPENPALCSHASREQVSALNVAVVSPDINRLMEPLKQGNKLVRLRLNDMEELDPVKQHRPFCPWISPTEGKHLPGWKLTLQALERKGGSPQKEAPHDLLQEGNDPLVSVRRLFSTPLKQKRSC